MFGLRKASAITVPDGHSKVLADLKVEIIITKDKTCTRNFRNLDASYVKVFNHNKVTFPTPYEGVANVTENVLVGMEDMETEPFDNYTDVLVQVTENVWGFDMDIVLMGGYRKKVYFRGTLLADSNVQRFTWVPLFNLYPDLKGKVKPPI